MPQALEIERHVEVPGGLQRAVNLIPQSNDLGNSIRVDLDAGQFSVVTHAQIDKTKLTQGRFRPVALRQDLWRDRRPILDPTGQARHCWFVPIAESQVFGQGSYITLIQTCFVERTAHAAFASGLPTRTVIRRIVTIEAIHDNVEAP